MVKDLAVEDLVALVAIVLLVADLVAPAVAA
jgi:hypothetical protein